MPAKKKATKKKEIDHNHIEDRTPEIEPEDLPTFDAVTLHQLPDMGNAGWVVLTMKIKGNKVIDVESSEPNLKAIAIEQLKINTVKLFLRE